MVMTVFIIMTAVSQNMGWWNNYIYFIYYIRLVKLNYCIYNIYCFIMFLLFYLFYLLLLWQLSVKIWAGTGKQHYLWCLLYSLIYYCIYYILLYFLYTCFFYDVVIITINIISFVIFILTIFIITKLIRLYSRNVPQLTQMLLQEFPTFRQDEGMMRWDWKQNSEYYY